MGNCASWARGRESSTGQAPLLKESKMVRDRAFRDVYTLGKTLGTGGFAIVKTCARKDTQQEFAVKVMAVPQEPGLDDMTRDDMLREIEIISNLTHPNVTFLHEYYEERNKIYLVTDIMRGGELLDAMLRMGRYSETESKKVFKQILAAIHYLHRNGIVHRDLKLENILLAQPGDLDNVQIVDFGLAKRSTRGGGSHKALGPAEIDLLSTVCGTPQYVAPEIITNSHTRKGYGQKADMWSLGVILYILISGYPPFHDDNHNSLFLKIAKGRYDFDDDVWEDVSAEAKDLIKKLLTVDPGKRLSSIGAIKHPWITGRRGSGGAIQYAKDLQNSLNRMEISVQQGLLTLNRRFKIAADSVMAIARMRKLSTASVGPLKEEEEEEPTGAPTTPTGAAQPGQPPSPISTLTPIKVKPRTSSGSTGLSTPYAPAASPAPNRA